MSKAIEGAAEIGLAIGFFAAAALIPGGAFLAASLTVDLIVAGIGVMGVGMEAGAIANALTSNRGEDITVRQPAMPRQIIYGTQRVGGNIVFLSTTGSSKDQFNFIIVISAHELWTIQSLYLDGRQSVSQAQRLAKIALLRNRQQGTGTMIFGLEGFNLQPNDAFDFTFPQRGWTNKLLEVNSVQFVVDDQLRPHVVVGVNETDPTVYEWSTPEELSVYAVEVAPNTDIYTTAPPTDMALISSAATALQQPDGTVIPRIEITWNTPLDVRVTQIAIQYRQTGTTTWTSAAPVDVSLNIGYISPVVAGLTYDVQIASQRSNGAESAWVQILNFTAGLVIASQTQIGVGVGSLVAQSFTNGTAAIKCNPFTAYIGTLSIPIFPSGAVTISGLNQSTLYYVYYIDPTTAGGNVTPIATTNKADFLGKFGYWLIDSITTTYSSTAGVKWYPSTYVDSGSQSTYQPTSPYDLSGNTATVEGVAQAYASGTSYLSTQGICTYSGFPNVIPTGDNINITMAVTGEPSPTPTGNTQSVVLEASFDGGTTWTTFETLTLTTASSTYTEAIPSDTNLDDVALRITATYNAVLDGSGGNGQAGAIAALITDIHIQ